MSRVINYGQTSQELLMFLPIFENQGVIFNEKLKVT